MKRAVLLIIGIIIILNYLQAQVAINDEGSVANASAMLDISSSSKGILMPRLTTNERITINFPANGLMVYDTETDSFWYYDADIASWIEVITSASSNINMLTDGRSDGYSIFIGEDAGTSDDFSLNNNIGIGRNALNSITTGSANIAIGKNSSNAATTAYGSIAIGEGALFYNTEKSGIAIGVEALSYNGIDATQPQHSNMNIAIGYQSLRLNTSGYSNISIGSQALISNRTGYYNVSIGAGSMSSNYVGYQNTAIGHHALYSNTESNNIAIGPYNMRDNTSGTSNVSLGVYSMANLQNGNRNIVMGNYALFYNLSGSGNISIGHSSGYYNQNGDNNTIIGDEAGKGSSTHSKSGNIFLGYQAGYNEIGSNKLYIENSNSSSPLIGGDFSTDEVYFNTTKLGIGTSAPRELLEVAASSGGYGRMIISDGGGDLRNALLFVSPTTSNQAARLEAFNYGSGGGLTLNINTTGHGSCVFGGNVLPENHTSKDLGASAQAWNNVYAHNYVTQGSAAFANVNVTEQLISFPPLEKAEGSFDEYTEKGLKELDPASLPDNLRGDNAILIDEMTTYNYKANYEQQLQIEELLSKNKNQQKIIDELIMRLNKLEDQ